MAAIQTVIQDSAISTGAAASAVAAPVAKVMLENYLMRCDGVVWRAWCLAADI